MSIHRIQPESPCSKCHGTGRYMYSHGSTWMGGMGTCAGQQDICNLCWGSGDSDAPFRNLKEMTESYQRQKDKTVLQQLIGLPLESYTEDLKLIVNLLKDFRDGRIGRKYNQGQSGAIASHIASTIERALPKKP